MIQSIHIKNKPLLQPSFGNTLNNTAGAFNIMEHYKNLSLENIVEVIDGIIHV